MNEIHGPLRAGIRSMGNLAVNTTVVTFIRAVIFFNAHKALLVMDVGRNSIMVFVL